MMLRDYRPRLTVIVEEQYALLERREGGME